MTLGTDDYQPGYVRWAEFNQSSPRVVIFPEKNGPQSGLWKIECNGTNTVTSTRSTDGGPWGKVDVYDRRP